MTDQKHLLEVVGVDAVSAFVAPDIFFGDVVVAGLQGLEAAESFLLLSFIPSS